jgi:peptide/nickel transport system permease protein
MTRRFTSVLSAPGRRFGALPAASKIALVLFALVALLAILAPWVAGDPLATGTPVQPPGSSSWFGTDSVGRDIFARVVYGARASLVIGLGATIAALIAASILGSVAATGPRWLQEVLMRVMDIIMSFPGIALAAVFVAVLGHSTVILIAAIGFVYMPQLTRVVRANVLEQFGEDYVAASKVMGAGTPRILIKHVARNCLAPVLVFATVLVAEAIVLEASLSFLSAGVKPPNPSWGNIMSAGKNQLLNGSWWPTFFPGLMLLITVLALNVLSEGMTDALVSTRRAGSADTGESEQTTDSAASRAAEETGGAEIGAERAESPEAALLDDRLAALHVSEKQRSDRLEYTADTTPILDIRNLSIAFPEAHGDVDVVDELSFSVRPGETMGLVGESGCGKSITSTAVMGLLPTSTRIKGEIRFDGRDVLSLSSPDLNRLRGHEIAMVYQDALSSLNPSMPVKAQMKQLTRRGGKRSAPELLEMVGLDPTRTLASYPHELSGGQRQRVLIGMALTRNPRLLIADEPTTALDVTVQKQVVSLLNALRDELRFAMVFVSHDLALVAQLAHRITVMYAGQAVESGTTTEMLTDPRHEYTRGLLGAVLSLEQGSGHLHQIPGTVPAPKDFVRGDRFAPRSQHPDIGRDRRPVMHRVPGTTHDYAAHAESEAMAEVRW